MKKIILLSVTVIGTLVSCSPEEIEIQNENSNRTRSKSSMSNIRTASDYFMTSRDSISKDNDTLIEGGNPKPIKP